MRVFCYILSILSILTSCNNVRTESINPLEENSLILFTDSNIYIHSIHLKIYGDLNGSADIFVGADKSNPHDSVRIEKGTVDLSFSGDFYSDTCYIKFSPINVNGGKLYIEYDFYGGESY